MDYSLDWSVLLEYRGLLLQGLVTTLQLSVLGFILSIVLSLVVSIARSSRFAVPRLLAASFVEFFKNVPLVVHLFYLYFVFGLDSFAAGLVGLVFYSTAFIAEVIRSGIEAIPKTQYEAAASSGLNTLQVVRHVIVPQAVMIVIPPLGTEFVNLIKNSAIAMTIAVEELTFMSQEIDAITFRGLESSTAATAIYVLLCLLVVGSLSIVERIVKIETKVL